MKSPADSSPGEIRYSITFLEMAAPLERAPSDAPDGFSVRRVREPQTKLFRRLYDTVGSSYEWTDFHSVPVAWLDAFIQDPRLELYVVEAGLGTTAGFFLLDVRNLVVEGVVNLVLFGLFPEFCGRGLGGWALSEALRRAWREGTRRVDVNTCTLDHPAALPLYLKAGFVPIRAEERTRCADSQGWQR